MAQNDIKVLKHPGEVRQFVVEDRTTSAEGVAFYFGEGALKGAAEANYVSHLCTGEPTIGAKEFIGITKGNSDETASADGTVDIYTIVPNQTVLRAKATTVANVNTEAKIYALTMDWVAFDVSTTTGGGTETIDENEGDDPNVHGLQIIDGDIINGTLDVIVHSMVTTAGAYY